MIEVKNLTKRYGAHIAVSDLSFVINKGAVYGFLGPNGAGKSTTMNIITGCLGATAGDVLIDGHNIVDEPMEAKRHIGYLPELPPLYMEMTVREYLEFVAQAKRIARRDWQQIAEVMEKTKITHVSHRLIRNLSKGYRQRVGIAQALLGNPEVIILDEPTVGLDPAQIIEIRDLIRELGQDHTIILSSHILSEVQAVCDHIMIISHGKLVASDTAENLTSLFAGRVTLRLEIKASAEKIGEALGDMDGIEEMKAEECAEDVIALSIIPKENADIREELFRRFAKADCPILEMRREKATLEDVFLELTQDGKDDADAAEEADHAAEDTAPDMAEEGGSEE